MNQHQLNVVAAVWSNLCKRWRCSVMRSSVRELRLCSTVTSRRWVRPVSCFGLALFRNVHADWQEVTGGHMGRAQTGTWLCSSRAAEGELVAPDGVHRRRRLRVAIGNRWDPELFGRRLTGWGGRLVGVQKLGPFLAHSDLLQQAERAQPEFKVSRRPAAGGKTVSSALDAHGLTVLIKLGSLFYYSHKLYYNFAAVWHAFRSNLLFIGLLLIQ